MGCKALSADWGRVARAIAVMLAAACCLAPLGAHARLSTAIARDGSDRIVLEDVRDGYNERTILLRVTSAAIDIPILGMAPCGSVGSQYLDLARSYGAGSDIARYNMVRLWMGKMCDGKSDALPKPAEAKAWLDELAGFRHMPDGAPFLDVHEMLADRYIFGAPGIEPDYAAALAFLTREVKTRPRESALYLAYLYEHGLGAPADEAQAKAWIERAAKAGNRDARALLAQADELGLGTARDETRALGEYLAISKGAAAPVWLRLGLMYFDGRGAPMDGCQAKHWFEKAAAALDTPQAKARLDQISAKDLCPAKK